MIIGPGTEPLKVNAHMKTPGSTSISFSSMNISTCTTRGAFGGVRLCSGTNGGLTSFCFTRCSFAMLAGALMTS